MSAWKPDELKQIIYLKDAYKALPENGAVVLVFESSFIVLAPREKPGEKEVEITYTAIHAKDGSKIFLDAIYIYISPNAEIVATTPTTYLIVTPRGNFRGTYDEFHGKDVEELVNPKITAGPNNTV